MRRVRGSLVLCTLALACSSGPNGAEAPTDAGADSDSDPGPDASDAGAVDRTDRLFEPGHLLVVEIEMDPSDWDALRTQTRTLEDTLFGADCLAEPFGSPFTWFEATVTIDGEVVEHAAVRKKGFLGSLDEEKPSLKVKLDQIVEEQQVSGEDDFVLNNSKQDPSYVRQCVSYDVFREVGVPAPRCNFARVTVNGVDLGAYIHVDRLDEDFLRRHFDDAEGNLYEGTLSDFQDAWLGTFEAKTNEPSADRRDLEAVIDALDVPDSELEGSLATVIDLREFVDFWATEVLVAHWDGYAGNQNNFFVYHDPASERLSFLPWGADGTLALQPGAPASVSANGVLAWRLYRHRPTRDLYLDRLQSILGSAWNEEEILDEIDRMEALLDDVADDRWGSRLAATEQVRQFVRERRAAIETEIASGPLEWVAPLRESFCLVESGSARGTFATTWGTADDEDPMGSGTGTLQVEVDGAAWGVTAVGSAAGPDADAVGRSTVQIVAALDDGTYGAVVMSLSDAAFVAGTPVSFDLASGFALVAVFEPAAGDFRIVGMLFGGSVTLDEAGTEQTEAVSGSFEAPLFQWPF